MLLDVHERIVLLAEVLRGVEGNFLALRTTREMREALSFTEEETAAFEITEPEGGGVQWNRQTAKAADVPLGDGAVEIITKRLRALDEAEKLSARHYTLCEKFLTNGKE